MKYAAFICYAHVDREHADALQRHLEKFVIPKPLRDRWNGLKRFTPVFRDDEDLEAHNDLTERIQDALATSAWLIVVCSPASAQSKWVNREIQFFAQARSAERIIPVLLAGEPLAYHAESQPAGAFPPALMRVLDASHEDRDAPSDPHAPLLRPRAGERESAARHRAVQKIAARMLSVSLTDLTQRREVQERYDRYRAATGLLAAIVVVGAVGLYTSTRLSGGAATQAELAQMREDILTAIRAEVARGNTVVTAQSEAMISDGLAMLVKTGGREAQQTLGLLATGDIAGASRRLIDRGEQLAATPETAGGEEIAQAFKTAGAVAAVNDTSAAIAAYQRSLEYIPGDYEVINQLAHLYARIGRRNDAKLLYRKILTLPAAQDRAVRALALSNLGRLESRERREPLLREALAIHRELGDQEGIAANLAGLASFEPTDAERRRMLEQSRDVSAELGDFENVARQEGNIGMLILRSGDTAFTHAWFPAAASHIYKALGIYEDIYAGRLVTRGSNRFLYEDMGVLEGVSAESNNLFTILRHAGVPYEEYIPYLERSVEAGEIIESAEAIVIGHCNLASEAVAQGDFERAEHHLDAAAPAPGEIEVPYWRACLAKTRARLEVERGNFDLACLHTAAVRADGISDPHMLDAISTLEQVAGCGG